MNNVITVAEVIIGSILFFFVFSGFVGIPIYVLAKNYWQKKADAKEDKQRIREAIEKLEKREHIRRRNDEYVPHKSQGSMTDRRTSRDKNQGYL